MTTYQEYNESNPWPNLAIDHNRYYQRELSIVKKAVSKQNWKAALDLGSGYGRASLALHDKANQWFCMDGAIKMLHQAKKNGVSWPLVNAEINSIWPFQDRSFHLVVGLQILNHSTHLPSFFSELKRVLHPTGSAFLSFGNSESFIAWEEGTSTIQKDGFERYTPKAVTTLAKEVGFSVKIINGSGLLSPHQKLFFLETFNRFQWTALKSHLVVVELST